jgi:hypothetical protein
VRIVEINVHPGTCVHALFLSDRDVLYQSDHKAGICEGTGLLDEAGMGGGAGSMVHFSFSPCVGEAGLLADPDKSAARRWTAQRTGPTQHSIDEHATAKRSRRKVSADYPRGVDRLNAPQSLQNRQPGSDSGLHQGAHRGRKSGAVDKTGRWVPAGCLLTLPTRLFPPFLVPAQFGLYPQIHRAIPNAFWACPLFMAGQFEAWGWVGWERRSLAQYPLRLGRQTGGLSLDLPAEL